MFKIKTKEENLRKRWVKERRIWEKGKESKEYKKGKETNKIFKIN